MQNVRGASIKSKTKLNFLSWIRGSLKCLNIWSGARTWCTDAVAVRFGVLLVCSLHRYSCSCHQKQHKLFFVVSDNSQSWTVWSLHRPWYRRTVLPSFQLLLWQLVHTGVRELCFSRAGAGLAWSSYRQECLAVGLGLLTCQFECAGGHFGISGVTYFLLIPCIPENGRRLLAWTFFSPLFLIFFFYFFKVTWDGHNNKISFLCFVS